MATTSRGTSTGAAILLAAICCSALALTGCEDRPRPARLAAPAPTEVVATATATATVTASATLAPTATATPAATDTPRPFRPPNVAVIDARDGTARIVGSANEVVAQRLSDQGAHLSLPMGGQALWIGRRTSNAPGAASRSVALVLLDGTVVGEWPWDGTSEPSASTDAQVVLVRDGEWTLFRNGVGARAIVPSSARFAQLSPRGSQIVYVELQIQIKPLDGPDAAIHVFDVETGADQIVDRVTNCQCGVFLRALWTPDGAAARYWTAVPGARGVDLVDRWWPASVSIGASTPRVPQPHEVRMVQPGCVEADAVTALVLNHELSASNCDPTHWRGVISPEGGRVAYFASGTVVVEDLKERTAIRASQPLTDSYWYVGPPLQWDSTGAYVVAIVAAP